MGTVFFYLFAKYMKSIIIETAILDIIKILVISMNVEARKEFKDLLVNKAKFRKVSNIICVGSSFCEDSKVKIVQSLFSNDDIILFKTERNT
jgi:hypothetical protein